MASQHNSDPDTPQVSYINDAVDITKAPHETDTWSNRTVVQNVEAGEATTVYAWSNFKAAIIADIDEDAMRDGEVDFRKDSCSECHPAAVGLVDHAETLGKSWASSLDLDGVTDPALSVDLTQESSGAGMHEYNVTATFSADSVEQAEASLTLDGSSTLLSESDVSGASLTFNVTANKSGEDGDGPGGGDETFEVASVDADDSVLAGENITVEAVIENTGTGEGTQTVEYFVYDGLEDEATVTLGPGETTTVEFTYSTPDSFAATVEHEVATEDDSKTVSTEVKDP